MTNQKPPPSPAETKAMTAKEKALADALRQNLMKRKQQSRARDTVAPSSTTDQQKEIK